MDEIHMHGETPDYYACLLRLWRDHPGAAWRAALIEPVSGARYSFATLAELVTFVEAQTGTTLRPSDEFPPSRE